ncbi:MAG: FkbM family methyltransferase [Candidatus Latescibacterota bacterium]
MDFGLIRILSALHLLGPAKALGEAILSRTPAYKRREQEMLRFYSRFIREGDLCFDVGANAGSRTALFLALGARVVAVDPQPSCLRTLRKRFSGNPMVSIVPKALGAEEGEAELLVSDVSTISTLSREWVESSRQGGRFHAYRWNGKVTVPVTTLDRLVEEYGVPAFCKIDVEGYEAQVLAGLSRPVSAASFEFVPEFLENALVSISHLVKAGVTRFNYSLGESMSLALSQWVSEAEIADILRSITDRDAWGDVYGVEKTESRIQESESRRKDMEKQMNIDKKSRSQNPGVRIQKKRYGKADEHR